VLGANVEEKPTGQLSLSGGYSSLERFVVQLGLSQNNFLGKGQAFNANVNWSLYSKSAVVGWSDPYFLDKPILFGVQLFRQDYSSFNYIGNNRNTTYKQLTTGGALSWGFPLSEYWNLGMRYRLSQDNVSLDRSSFYTNGTCDPLKAGSYLCEEVGNKLTSLVGWSTLYDDTDGIHPTRGQQATISQDFAGLGGDVRYLRTQAFATKYHSFGNWILSLHGEGGYIKALQSSQLPGEDPIRITDRFFNSNIRGFDIRGIGPRVVRIPYDAQGNLEELDVNKDYNEAIGGKAYYLARLEMELPVSASVKSLGLRPSVYVDAGSLWNVTKPTLVPDTVAFCAPKTGTTGLSAFGSSKPDCSINQTTGQAPPGGATSYVATPGFREVFLGNSPKPRVSVGFGVNWVSPFGPLRIDIAKALIKQEGDDPKLFQFNVGTQF
jgi:outer membrane protein insertion porin family